jgi:glycine/D-amino acid oxidase-like deaminating enzyme
MLSEGQRFDFAVVGGGVYGLSAAYFLSKTEAKVALF